MISDQQIKKKKSVHVKEMIKRFGSQQQRQLIQCTSLRHERQGLMSTGPSVPQSEVERENGQGAGYSGEAFSM